MTFKYKQLSFSISAKDIIDTSKYVNTLSLEDRDRFIKSVWSVTGAVAMTGVYGLIIYSKYQDIKHKYDKPVEEKEAK